LAIDFYQGHDNQAKSRWLYATGIMALSDKNNHQ